LVLVEQLEIGKQGLFLLSTNWQLMDLLLEVDQISNMQGMFNQDLRPWGLARGKWV
jgi:hypothetical protein